MLQIKQKQMSVLCLVPQEIFLKKMVKHLKETSQIIRPKAKVEYESQEAVERLRSEMSLLMKNGFDEEPDIAAAIEYFELFNVDPNNEDVLQIIENREFNVQEKLDALEDLSQKQIFL